jgi:hypothetical protein
MNIPNRPIHTHNVARSACNRMGRLRFECSLFHRIEKRGPPQDRVEPGGPVAPELSEDHHCRTHPIPPRSVGPRGHCRPSRSPWRWVRTFNERNESPTASQSPAGPWLGDAGGVYGPETGTYFPNPQTPTTTVPGVSRWITDLPYELAGAGAVCRLAGAAWGGGSKSGSSRNSVGSDRNI